MHPLMKSVLVAACALATAPLLAQQSAPAKPVPAAAQAARQAAHPNCPSGTHWYEPAKACVANGGHPGMATNPDDMAINEKGLPAPRPAPASNKKQ